MNQYIVKLNELEKLHPSKESAQAAYDRCEPFVMARGGHAALIRRTYAENFLSWTDNTIVEMES